MKKLTFLYFIIFLAGLNVPPLSFSSDELKVYDLSLSDATQLALENNFDVQIAKYDASISSASLDSVKSIFDTILNSEIKYQNDQSKRTSSLLGSKAINNDYNIGVSKKFSTGTQVDVDMTNNRNWSDSSFSTSSLQHDSSLGLSVTQELGKNFFGLKDRGNVKIKKIDIENSHYTSLEKIEEVVSSVQKAYWDLVLAMEKVKIQKEMVSQAKRLYDLHQEKLKDGLVEMPEAIASEANYKVRLNKWTLAKNLKKTKENVLKLLLTIDEACSIRPKDPMNLTAEGNELSLSLKSAFENRRDLKKVKNEINSQDIILVLEKNNRLPEVNLWASFARNGLGDHFKQSVTQISAEDNPDYSLGLSISFPLENRDAKSRWKSAEYAKAKTLINLKLIERKIIVEINDQVRNCHVYRELALSSRDIAQLQLKKFQEEAKRFNLGRSDTDTLIRYQEDLITAKEAAVSDQYQFLISLIDLKLKEGLLLGPYDLN